jgi:hypothetical protein
LNITFQFLKVAYLKIGRLCSLATLGIYSKETLVCNASTKRDLARLSKNAPENTAYNSQRLKTNLISLNRKTDTLEEIHTL